MEAGAATRPAEPGDLHLDRWADDVRELCEALRIERPIVLGLGFGSLVAIRYAARHPGDAGALVLAAPVARVIPERSTAVYERLGGEAAREVAEHFHGAMDKGRSPTFSASAFRCFPDRLGGSTAGDVAARYFADPTEATFAEFLRVCVPLYTRTPNPDGFARIEMNLALTAHWDRDERHFDLRDDAAQIACPTLVLAGEDDPSTTIAGTEELLDALPLELARLHRFPNAGHGVFRDAPEALELVREFVLAERGEAPR